MPIPASKSELLAAIDTGFVKLVAALDAIPPDRSDEKSMQGHAKDTLMSANNLVSYLIGWNALVAKWLEQDAKGETVIFPEVGYKWNTLGALAQKFYADYADQSFEENRRRLVAAKDRLTDEVIQRSDDELYGHPWHGKWTKGRMIQLNSSSPYKNARGRLRRWVKSLS